MAEVIDENHVLPHRMYALVQVVASLPEISRDALLDLVQPESVHDVNRVSQTNYRRSLSCGLLIDDGGKERITRLGVDPLVATDFEAFRRHMQDVLLGVTDDNADHFTLNIFTAWFATQDEVVLKTSKQEWEILFADSIFPGRVERLISEHPGITTWLAWAEFLGFGAQSDTLLFLPDCTRRLMPLLPELLPTSDSIPFGAFMERLAARCPELDGGALFERCWAASHPSDVRGNRLSLMLSTGLRVLHELDAIVLDDRADATRNWTLYPSQSRISRVTHIRIGEPA